jgi:hypothetical protein
MCLYCLQRAVRACARVLDAEPTRSSLTRATTRIPRQLCTSPPRVRLRLHQPYVLRATSSPLRAVNGRNP